MIELNLLPDVKLEYINAQRTRRLIISISLLVTAVAVVILLLLLSVDGLQKKHLSDLNHDITSEDSKLQNEPQINKILTVQNQLESLTTLHNGKPAVSRLFDYLNEVTPSQVSITNFTANFTQQTMTITGTADSLSTVNQYIDTLKFTNYTTDSNKTPSPAFSDVVLSSFGLTTDTSTATGPPASYTITLSYDQTIFDITQGVKLSVPSLTTTRSTLDQPTDLFKDAPASSSKGSN
jgi:Tfp pilus assembly protein PilN